MKADKIIEIKTSSFKKLGGKLATRIVKDADKGISQDGSGRSADFKAYSEKYAFLKSKGLAGRKGVSKSRQINPPNLRLTNEMLNSIKAGNATDKYVDINFRDGDKVIGHSKRRGKRPKRNIYGLNDKNLSFAENFLENEINSNVDIFHRKSINLTVKI